ncbi:hypothetical protein [Archangium violaceum]|uniref:Uncharacterized protein n=1 Tax=Archangium violaceum Cb vi76 TaxID=1406225 RepID=A0A084SYY7_9BACT|nr:hypothetical protein [Archangium violaceum]KFA93672.1 hypothetical protein Q664_07885 [Archangium violaceum Cb vi76]
MELNIYMLPASDAKNARLREFVRSTLGKRATPGTLEQLQAQAGWENDHITLKLVAITYQHLKKYKESERLLRRLFLIARHGTDRCAALANLAVGYFRQNQYELSFLLAVRAMRFDPTVVSPWLIAAAAVGRLGDYEQLARFCIIFEQAFNDLAKHPAVVWALLGDPDLEEFVCSEAFVSRLEDKLLEAQEALEASGVAHGPEMALSEQLLPLDFDFELCTQEQLQKASRSVDLPLVGEHLKNIKKASLN